MNYKALQKGYFRRNNNSKIKKKKKNRKMKLFLTLLNH